MSAFTATTRSQAIVAADPPAIWNALTDPHLLPQLTPLLTRIEVERPDLWRWHLMRISALGVGISPVFTEHMQFQPMRRIEFTHQPPAGVTEHAGVVGTYQLAEHRHGTRLAVELTMRVELPLPRLSAPAVQRVMTATMARTGERFSENLLRHLGLKG
jgi:carbon monoxide dehydrogenase subunit G